MPRNAFRIRTPRVIRGSLNGLIITIGLVFLTIFLLFPLLTVFVEGLRKGLTVYWKALGAAEARCRRCA